MTEPTKTSTDYILLKWGTLKGWKLTSEKSHEILRKYTDIGYSLSSMTQKDTPEQKQILCDLIREHDGTITNDWDGDQYTKEQAIDYITNYGKRDG